MTTEKIAILGGGFGALTAAYYLTDRPGWEKDYEVCVYQMGWRLGGKAASGRNEWNAWRSEELGPTSWAGFYDNAFAMMRAVYEELDRPAGAPLRTWEQAFLPQSFVVWQELHDGDWSDWLVNFPENSDEPGDEHALPSVWACVEMILGWLVGAMRGFPLDEVREAARKAREDEEEERGFSLIPDWLRGVVSDTRKVVGKIFDGSPLWLLREAASVARLVSSDQSDYTHADDIERVVDLLDSFMEWFEDQVVDLIWDDREARRFYILMALGAAIVRGMVADNVLVDDFFLLDDYDLREWLSRHGAHERVVNSAPVRAYYDYHRAYRGGDRERPSLSAGSALEHLLRLVCAYNGAVFYKLAAGGGEVVFAPLYEVLRERGVKFEFFHEVTQIELTSDHEEVGKVRMVRQARVKNGGAYQPLVDVNGLLCWPSAPDLSQLEGGAALGAVDLESAGVASAELIELELGRDFDYVVSGLPIQVLGRVAGDLLKNDRRWRIAVDQLETCATQVVQAWYGEGLSALGWVYPAPISSGYAPAFCTWSDRSTALGFEDWPAAPRPASVERFVGVLRDADAGGPRPDEEVEQAMIAWLAEHGEHLFAELVDGGQTAWDKFFAGDGVVGEDRLRAQFIKANVTPGARSTLSLPQTNRFRMTPEASGYKNLALVGDWLYTGYCSCVESAVMTGKLASRALTGSPEVIVGECERVAWQAAPSLVPILEKGKEGAG